MLDKKLRRLVYKLLFYNNGGEDVNARTADESANLHLQTNSGLSSVPSICLKRVTLCNLRQNRTASISQLRNVQLHARATPVRACS